MGLLLDLFNLIAYGIFLKEVKEEKIGRNIEFLKRYGWFQKCLANDELRELIIHDADVRLVIGKCNRKKMKRRFYRRKYQKKIYKVLMKKGGVS